MRKVSLSLLFLNVWMDEASSSHCVSPVLRAGGRLNCKIESKIAQQIPPQLAKWGVPQNVSKDIFVCYLDIKECGFG